ncbi:hypothetical protein ABIE62_000776 [Porphyrobacter sp. MBR-155]
MHRASNLARTRRPHIAMSRRSLPTAGCARFRADGVNFGAKDGIQGAFFMIQCALDPALHRKIMLF